MDGSIFPKFVPPLHFLKIIQTPLQVVDLHGVIIIQF